METTPKTRSLRELARAVAHLNPVLSGDVDVAGLAYDSRSIDPGDLFFCIPGATSDGHAFAGLAVSAGAAALCVERPTRAGVPELMVDDVRRAMPMMAAEWFGRPADDMMLIGITGTNGKTTTAFILESILAAAGHTTGLIGTIETRIAGKARPGVRTTPESLDLQRLFADMRTAGVDAVAMEVTSHALVLHRVDAVRFAAAAFTNLSQDHLDFHAGMEDYFSAKRSLFELDRTRAGAINADDPYGQHLLRVTKVPSIGFGLSSDADVRAEGVKAGGWQNEFVVIVDGGDHPHGEIKVSTPLVGAFNVSNCLAAAAAALQAGVPLDAIEAGLRDLKTVPGRFEPVDEGQAFSVVVDYSHTPDSLDNALREARLLVAADGGRVISVFGCGGDRDRGKRPLMGAAAARNSDVVIVTSDNPRSEDPISIIDQILEGVLAQKADGPDAVLVDRREAIARAVELASPGDIVVIAGKGHESGQEFADHVAPFDDRDVVRQVLAESGAGNAR